MTKPDHRKTIEIQEDCNYIVRGLRTETIREPAVPVFIGGRPIGSFQAIEMYQRQINSKYTPQVFADIIANTYFRPTYLESNRRSGTFGSSVVATPSFRSGDGTLNLVPAVKSAEIFATSENDLDILLTARFSDSVEVTTLRSIRVDPLQGTLQVVVKQTFCALQDIRIAPAGRIGDRFRLLTVSSMFAASDCYDTSAIEWYESGESKKYTLRGDERRAQHLFPAPIPGRTFKLLKERGSRMPRGDSGAFDSPTLSIEIFGSSIPAEDLGLQAYLDASTNRDDDSLSAWIEWIKCPPVIEQGREISVSFSCAAGRPD